MNRSFYETNNYSIAVDDDESLRLGIRDILALEGYKVSMAADGIAALDALRIIQFDLVMLDINMPRLDGMEVLKFIKNNALDCQVVMLSAMNDIQTAVECIKLGAFTDYLLEAVFRNRNDLEGRKGNRAKTPTSAD